MGRRRTDSARRIDNTGKMQVIRKQVMRKQPMPTREEQDREYFESRIKRMKEGDEMEMPIPKIVKYHDFVEKLWGWDKLLPRGDSVSRSAYSNYLEAYYINTETPAKSLGIAAIAETCRKKEEELVLKWKDLMESEVEMFLPMSKSIVLSCLILQRASSFIQTANCEVSHVSNAALWCIEKEADLTLELLRRRSPWDDYLIDQGSMIRMCALSLMNYTSKNSVAASAAMLGMAKEAEMLCQWMDQNHMVIDFDDDPSDVLVDSRIVRYRTLDVMVPLLEESAAAASDSGGHKIDEAANITGITGGDISDELNSHYQKIQDSKRSNKRKRNKEDLWGKLWGWERLLPLPCSVYSSEYLEEYYNQNAIRFIADAVQSDTTDGCSLSAALANYSLEKEKELVSEWKTRVPRRLDNTLPMSTVVQSSLIKERVLAICGTVGELSVRSAVAFVCITNEADLMCELLKHGAKPTDDMIQQSSVIRMCALGLLNLKGNQSIAYATAMMGMAKEAKRMSGWMKRENKLLTLSLSVPCELEGFSIRARSLDFIIRILLVSLLPSKMEDDALTESLVDQMMDQRI